MDIDLTERLKEIESCENVVDEGLQDLFDYQLDDFLPELDQDFRQL